MGQNEKAQTLRAKVQLSKSACNGNPTSSHFGQSKQWVAWERLWATSFVKESWPNNGRGGRILRKSDQEFGQKWRHLQVAIGITWGSIKVDPGEGEAPKAMGKAAKGARSLGFAYK